MDGTCICNKQWWNVTRHIHSSIVLKYKFEVLILYFSISILLYLILPLRHFMSQANIALFTPLQLLFRLQFFIPFLLSENHVPSNLVILNLIFSDKLKDEVFLYVLRKFSYFLRLINYLKTWISWKIEKQAGCFFELMKS